MLSEDDPPAREADCPQRRRPRNHPAPLTRRTVCTSSSIENGLGSVASGRRSASSCSCCHSVQGAARSTIGTSDSRGRLRMASATSNGMRVASGPPWGSMTMTVRPPPHERSDRHGRARYGAALDSVLLEDFCGECADLSVVVHEGNSHLVGHRFPPPGGRARTMPLRWAFSTARKQPEAGTVGPDRAAAPTCLNGYSPAGSRR